jgi:hypothetical protein
MRFATRRSRTSPALFSTPRWREIDGPLIGNWSAISPALRSPSRRSWRIWRRVGSASALKTRPVGHQRFRRHLGTVGVPK